MHKLQKEGHEIRLSSEMEKSLFLIRLTRIRNQLISDVLDLLFQIRNIERRFADDNGLAVFLQKSLLSLESSSCGLHHSYGIRTCRTSYHQFLRLF